MSHDHDPPTKSELHFQLAKLENEIKEFVKYLHDADDECSLNLIGAARLNAMTQNQLAAESYLIDSDHRTRGTALGILGSRWKPSMEIAEKCEEFVRSDPSSFVRVNALYYLAGYYRNTSNRRIAQLLADKLNDESEGVDVRNAAYDCLLSVCKADPETRPTLKIVERKFRFPEDVDWKFVQGCVQ